MLYLHVGKPRSGKTYDVMRSVVLPALEKGRRVLTNIEGLENTDCREWIAARCGVDVDSRLIWLDETAIRLGKWYEEPQNGDCYIIDECQMFWPGGSLKPSDQGAFSFMTRHGHYNTDIHLITQDVKNVDAHMRRLCGQTQLYRKLGFIGLSGSYQVQTFNGSEPLPALHIATTTRRYDPEIFKAYKSIVEGADVPQTRQANLLTSKKFLVLYLVLAVGLIFTLRACSKFRDRGFAPDASSSSSVVSNPLDNLKPHRGSAGSISGIRVVGYSSSFVIDSGITALRLSDGSIKLVPSLPLRGGFYFADSVFYAPVFSGGRDD